MDVAADPVPATHRPDDPAAARRAHTTGAFRWSHLADGVPVLVWLVTGLHLLLLVTYSIAVPLYRAPDEPAHVDMVLALAEDRGWPAPGERFFSAGVSASLLHSRLSVTGAPADIDLRALQASDAQLRAERPTFEDLDTDGPTPWQNQLSQHPPLYYVAGHAVVIWATALTPDLHWSYDRVIGVLRLFSAGLVAGLPLAAFAVARRLRVSEPVAVAAAMVPLVIPMLTHIGSTVNSDNLLVALFAAAFVLFTYVATGDLSRRTAVWVGVVGALALLTKGFALVVPVWAVVAYALGMLRSGAVDRRWLTAAGVALATMAAGGWWWVRNLAVHGAVQPRGSQPPDVADGSLPVTDTPFLDELARLPERFWGAFGWTQVTLPDGAVSAATVVLVAGLLAALVAGGRGRPWSRADVGLLLLPFLLVGGGVLWGAWTGLIESGLVRGIQGRYLFVGVVGLAVAAVLAVDRFPARVQAGLPLLVLAAAVALHGSALTAILGHFWSGFTGLGPSVEALLLWSAWPRTAVLALAGALAVVVVATAAEALRRALPR